MSRPFCCAPAHRWGLRATLAGGIACGLSALVCTTQYLVLPGAMRLDWSQMPWAIALVVLVGGICMGVCVGGATLLAARRGAGVGGLTLAGALGGSIAGLAPGLLGVGGFGSLDAPYAGTANILSSILLGAITFVALWSPQLTGHRRRQSRLILLGRSALASVISLGAVGMVAWSLARALDLVPSVATMADLAATMGLLPFSLMVGALLGTAGGAAIGAACGLVVFIKTHHA